ncbi:MAG: LytTR family transcriptional regulator [Flavobacteriales bacterium]|nr:LytTR family transcriptional regulator [Flavobacteriales bacterium]
MRSILGKPFPALAETRQKVRSACFIAFFVFGFLSIFKPFGISNVQGNFYFVTMLYGLITLIILLLTQLIFPNIISTFYDEQKWNVGREIIHTMANILFIAIGNFLLSCFLKFFPWSLDTFLRFVGFTFAIGIIPVSIQVLIRQNVYHKRNQKAVIDDNEAIAQRANPDETNFFFTLKEDEGKNVLTVESSEVLAIESSGNYIDVHTRSAKPTTLRRTITSAERELPSQYLRVHRSWIVNLKSISKVYGNARGYTLEFENSQLTIPVSRSKLKEFDTRLAELSR